MDDSDVALMLPHKEVNGNLALPSQLFELKGKEEEIDEQRAFLSCGLDETDGSPRSTLSSIRLPPCSNVLQKLRNDSEDDGYCSQDQMPAKDPTANAQRFRSSSPGRDFINNNLNNMSTSADPSLGDCTGKVFSVTLPRHSEVRSNERRTTFRPNLNEMSTDSDGSVGVCLQEISSRHSVGGDRIESAQRRLHVGEVQHTESGRLRDRIANDNDKYTNSANLNNENAVAEVGPLKALDSSQAADEAGTGREHATSRKRKDRDEEDGDDMAASDTKRLCAKDVLARQPLQAPLSRQHPPRPARHPPRPASHYAIQGQANWVVQGAQDCRFFVINNHGSSGGQAKQHCVDWAQGCIQEIEDAKLKRAFEETAAAVPNALGWKCFARRLLVSQGPSLEKELQQLELCSGSATDKTEAVLVRWWRQEWDGRGDEVDGVRALLRERLWDCGMKRTAREVDRIFH